ncbi:YdcF family protein [Ramlibacter sp. XY19]|uniref:YdcF family protein n=1 Tax=Ramlibacter paludis TaxID=2908000 RepID=UPI0023DB5AE8|nr:YdcF family protein [Ramlibacter paludis]MCG2594189.1 YdcF family protein [Ramlibacter paludis]
MLPGELKPILTALALPPAGPLFLALAGLLLARRRRRAGLALAFVALLGLFLASTNGVAVFLARNLLPQVPVVQAAELESVQAIVVLGGGVDLDTPEYGSPQLDVHAQNRLRYGAWLARRTGKPLAYAGGLGWAAVGTQQEPEAQVARRVAQEDYGLALRWLEDRSRDTRENALFMAEAMKPDAVRRVALVTDSWHMPRAVKAFRAAGFEVVAAPTGYPQVKRNPVLEWLPSDDGLRLSRQVLREWLGLRVAGG